MAAPFVVTCTECQSKLKLKDDSFVGKKLRCPKCQAVFVVPGGASGAAASAKGPAGKGPAGKRPAKPKGEFDLSNISEDDYEPPPPAEGEEEQELEELPASPLMKKQAASKGGKKKKKRASSGPDFGRIALVGALVLLGIGVVGGMGYGIYTIVSGLGGGVGRFAWLPEDAELIADIRVSEILAAPVLQPLLAGELGKDFQQKVVADAPFDIHTVERLVIGASLTTRQATGVAYASAPIDQSKITEGSTPTDYNGYTLHTSRGNTLFFPDERTLVFGPEASLKAAIDRQGEFPLAASFDSLPTDAEIAVRTLKLTHADGSMSPAFAATGVDSSQLKSLTMCARAGTDLDLEIVCECHDAAAAEKLTADFATNKATALEQIRVQKEQLVPNPFIDVEQLKSLLTGVETALQSHETTVSGSTAQSTITVPGSLVKQAADMATKFAPMLQGLGGGLPTSPGGTPGSNSSPAAASPSESGETP